MSNNDTSNNVPADTVSKQRKLEAIDQENERHPRTVCCVARERRQGTAAAVEDTNNIAPRDRHTPRSDDLR